MTKYFLKLKSRNLPPYATIKGNYDDTRKHFFGGKKHSRIIQNGLIRKALEFFIIKFICKTHSIYLIYVLHLFALK